MWGRLRWPCEVPQQRKRGAESLHSFVLLQSDTGSISRAIIQTGDKGVHQELQAPSSKKRETIKGLLRQRVDLHRSSEVVEEGAEGRGAERVPLQPISLLAVQSQSRAMVGRPI